MNKVIGLLIITVLLLFSACRGDSEDSSNLENGQQKIEMVADSLSIEMEELKEDIEQTVDELDSLLEEID